MAFIPTNFDFPNATEYDSDLREVLKITKETYDEYNTMYSRFLELDAEFQDIQTRFDAFEQQLEGLDDYIDEKVREAVAREMVAFTAEFNALALEIRSEFSTLSSSIDQRFVALTNTLNAKIDVKIAEIDTEFARLRDNIINQMADIVRRYNVLEEDLRATMARALAQYNRFMHEIKEALDAGLLEIEEEIASIESRWLALDAEMQQKFADLETELRQQIADDNERNVARMLYLMEELREENNRKIAELEARIDALIKEFPLVYNPVKGQKTDVETAILDVYDADRTHALTARGYDLIGYTAAGFDAYEFSALDLDTISRDLFFPTGQCINPFTQKKECVCKVIDYVARELVGQAITCDEYAALDLTADDYAAYEITAYDFKFYSKTILTA